MSLFSGETPRDTVVAWAFVIVQFVLLVGVLWVPPGDDWPVSDALRAVARVLQYAGLLILVVGLVNLGRSLTPLPTPVPHGELRTGGLYRFSRHPIYVGVLGLAAGSALRSANLWALVLTVALTGLFRAKAAWEEERLRGRYPGYADYAERTARFIPGPRRLLRR